MEGMINKTLDQIEHAEIMIGFYKSLEKEEKDEKKKGSISLKYQMLEDGMKDNDKFIDYWKTLIPQE